MMDLIMVANLFILTIWMMRECAYLMVPFVISYGKAFRNEAEGSFLNGLKDGKWHYFFKSDTHRMKLTVDYVKGNIDGYLYYE